MLVTEDEARTIRCPLSYGARFTDPYGAQVITDDDHVTAVMAAPSFCIGSKCMAWRRATNDHKQFGWCGMAGLPWQERE